MIDNELHDFELHYMATHMFIILRKKNRQTTRVSFKEITQNFKILYIIDFNYNNRLSKRLRCT